MNKNILFISYDGMTDPLGQSQVLPYLVGLSAKGWNITLLSTEKKERSHYVNVIEEICEKASIHWVRIDYTKKPPVISTVLDVIKLYFKAKKMHKAKDFKIVHCRSYISALVGQSLKKKYGVKFIFDMRGFWADERIDGGIWNIQKPLYKLLYTYFKAKEKQFLHSADYVISLTNAAKCIIENDIAQQKLSIEVIPCCADTDHFSITNTSQFEIDLIKKQLNILPSDKIIGYVGSLGTWYMLDEMMFFFKSLHLRHPHYKFLFITIDHTSKIYDCATKFDVPHEQIIATESTRAQLPNYMSLMQSSIFFIKPAFSKQASSPTKMGELLAMGIPVLANKGVGDTAEFIQINNCGLVIEGFSIEELNSAVEKILIIETLDASQIRASAIKGFSLNNGVNQYDKVYNALID
jgi:glycosyltransferase involved in cell wall biosynthesis